MKDVRKGANLSKTAYDVTVDGLKVISNEGGGDCFFLATADAINYYNRNKTKNRITLNGYGTDKIFTQSYLRQIVYDQLVKTPFDASPLFAVMNDEFENKLKQLQPVGEAEYASLIDSVFEANDNFLVKKPTGEMDLQNTSPFKIGRAHV